MAGQKVSPHTPRKGFHVEPVAAMAPERFPRRYHRRDGETFTPIGPTWKPLKRFPRRSYGPSGRRGNLPERFPRRPHGSDGETFSYRSDGETFSHRSDGETFLKGFPVGLGSTGKPFRDSARKCAKVSPSAWRREFENQCHMKTSPKGFHVGPIDGKVSPSRRWGKVSTSARRGRRGNLLRTGPTGKPFKRRLPRRPRPDGATFSQET